MVSIVLQICESALIILLTLCAAALIVGLTVKLGDLLKFADHCSPTPVKPTYKAPETSSTAKYESSVTFSWN